MNPYKIPLDWFVCPITKEKLQFINGSLRSSRFVYHQHPTYRYWDFFPQESLELEKSEWKIWEQLQANAIVSYQADPEHNLGVGKRKDFIQFADFCSFHGSVLDIGVGPQRIPTHIEFCSKKDVFFVGIDPLEGDQPRAFAYVRGLGEYLPFKNSLFDQVLFVTSIDHFIDPIIPLLEARRVVKYDGEICIWFGQKDKATPKPQDSHEWYENLSVPTGAEDRFHYRRVDGKQFENYLSKADLTIKKREIISVDRWRRNLFYVVTR
jgi:SAM-dependent methyltransferase